MKVAVIILTVLIGTSTDVSGQSLLVIPDLGVGSDTLLTPQWRAGQTRGGVDFDLVGSMSPATSSRFWGEAQSSILPGSSVGVGEDRAAIYTEIGKVLSGSWRIAIGTALAAAEEDTAAEGADSAIAAATGFSRFAAGGGNLSVSGIRPLILAKLGEYTRGALLAVPRAWLNVPTLSSAEGVSDYGAEFAASLLLQRHDNESNPFLTLELRASFVGGSNEFYRAIGWDQSKAFVYLAPSLTMALRDQVNIGVSTFLSDIVDGDPAMTVSLTLLNRDGSD